MINISENELTIINGIISDLAPDCDVLAFGSRYYMKAKRYSDLDLAFMGDKKLGLKRCFQLEDAFAESDLPYRVDVLDYYILSPEFRAIIDSGNEKIYWRND
ncbi:MAG: nucleotidyltransferase domain-containing protein [Treponema sp.]|jgi:type I restriction enzyme S subunit|nr:nucleotidyltransferase domain-containing protein [Treponema sp.]